MKSSALIAISLTLLMFLLVLLAAFFFLFQGQLALRAEVTRAQDELRSLEQDYSNLELSQSATQATLVAVSTLQATTAAENVELSSQLADADRQAATQEAQAATAAAERTELDATLEAYEGTGPLINVVEPVEPPVVDLEQPIELLVVASDMTGVTAVNISVGDEFLTADDTLEEGDSVTVRKTWIPTVSGSFVITITATNGNGTTSEPVTIPVTVNAAPPTVTPQATAVPIPTTGS